MKLEYGNKGDIGKWMELVREVRGNFPGLETEDGISSHEETVLKFMGKRQAICVKDGGEIAGVMLFSRGYNMICCLAVAPVMRRKGVATMLMDEALSQLDRARDITVSTFREGDPWGDAPRALYKKYGFIEGELTVEFDYPNQVFTLPHI